MGDLPSAKLSVDVKNSFEPKYAIIKGKERHQELKKQASESEQVLLATDPDREGEAISWHLATILGLDLNEKNRVTFNEITQTGIKNGMANPRAVDIDLVNAQQARRILDRLVGYRLSPFVSQKIRRGLSAGRVQSVAVRLIVDREEEIKAFVPEEYWSIDAKLVNHQKKCFTAAFTGDETGKIKLTNKEQTDGYMARLENAVYTISSIKEAQEKSPLPPFITSTLSRGVDAARLSGAAHTRRAGALRGRVEGIGITGLITYMRTDSLRISEDARAQAAEFIKERFGEKYLPTSRIITNQGQTRRTVTRLSGLPCRP